MSCISGITTVEKFHNPDEGRNIWNTNFELVSDTVCGIILSGGGGVTTVVGSSNITAISAFTSNLEYTISLSDDVIINSVSATTISGGTIYSGGTDLYDIFATGTGDITRVQPGTNITTGGTDNFPIVNLNNNIALTSIDATSISGDTIYSGSTDLGSIFVNSVIGGNNIDISGTSISPIVHLSDNIIINSLSATSISGGTIYSGGTDLYDIFLTSAPTGITGSEHETVRIDSLGNPVSSGILLNDAAGVSATTYMTVGTRTGVTIGANSFTNGLANVASGAQSRAGGYGTVASGDYSVANGYTTLASGISTRAEGFNASATTDYAWSVGYGTYAPGWAGFAQGYFTEANATLGFAIGWNSQANGDEAFAGGFDTRADGVLSFAYGDVASATSFCSFAIGDTTLASGAQSFAGGFETEANNINDFAFGWKSKANGWGSMALGLESETISQGAFAQGGGVMAGRIQGGGVPGTGRYAHATGYFTWAYGDNSHAGGGGVFDGPYVYAVGHNSFNHSEVNFSGYTSSGASADNSAILGGVNQVVDSGALRSVVLGGHGITATTADTVYVPALNVYSALTNDNALTEVLVRDTDGTIKYRSAGSIGAQGDFLPLTGGTGGPYNFTGGTSANTLSLQSTTEAQLTMAPVNAAAPADNSMWFTTSGGTTVLNYRVAGVTKSVELT